MKTTTALTLQDIIARMESTGYTYAIRNGRLTKSMVKYFKEESEALEIVDGPADQYGNPEPWLLTSSIPVLAAALCDGRSWGVEPSLQIVEFANRNGEGGWKTLAFDEIGQMCSDDQELFMDIADLRYFADMEQSA